MLVRDSRTSSANGALGRHERQESAGMRLVTAAIAPGSPWQNGYAERLTGTIRRECVDHLIVFGEAELGQNMKLGIDAAFKLANANGGVYGRQLRLIAADDGYEPARAAVTMKQLYERDQVFGLVGNVGTPTAVVALPYASHRGIGLD